MTEVTSDIKKADWELDFYSRPILEKNGKKRWELLISSTQHFEYSETFRWGKTCPASEVNSVWLSKALEEALNDCKDKGWKPPNKLRCWRTSMKTMISKAAEKVGIEVVESRRTFALYEWLSEREREVYPKEEGYITGPIAPNPSQILNQPVPLPEAIRGDAWSFSSISIEDLREAKEWPMGFNSLIYIKSNLEDQVSIPGLRLFSKSRALALSAWLSGLEPLRLLVEKNQLLLEAGKDDRWLVTDMSENFAKEVNLSLLNSRNNADGIQFISIQSSPEQQELNGFWMLKDINNTF